MSKKILLAACLLFLIPGFARMQAREERVTHFSADISLSRDSSATIKETIEYDFGSASRHGINRYIPYSYNRDGLKYSIRLHVQSVTDQSGAPYPFSESRSSGNVVLKIGDAKAMVTGEKTYVIRYTVDRVVNFFKDHDEFYWNVTGVEWDVPIEAADAHVTLENAEQPAMVGECFTGAYGSKTTACTTTPEGSSIDTATAKSLKSHEGLTLVVSFLKGIIHQPTKTQLALETFKDNWLLGLPVVIWLFLHILWLNIGRDPKVRQAVIPEYEPPDKLLPGEIGTLWDEKADTKDISATIIDFAVRGYIKIRYLEDKNYEFIKLQANTSGLSAYEKDLLDSIFLNLGTLTKVELKSLEDRFYKDLPDIQKGMYDSCISKGYFTSNPNTMRNAFRTAAAMLVAFPLFLGGAFLQSAVAFFAFIASAILFAVYGQIMPKRTISGTTVKIHIHGFKWFLSVTEEERLKFHNAPAKKPELFEKFLPYAMALGVEKEWAGQFASIYTQQPSWYEGGSFAAFNAIYFASAMSSMTSHMNSTFVSHPSQAGGGGSGFGGGGFSGGGFGGGGGGSW